MAGWAPKGLERVAPNDPIVTSRRWVAIAEEAAPRAVELFTRVMDNPKYNVKIRMEAATRLLQVAGLTLRGEKRDGQGRPAVVAATRNGQSIGRLEGKALSKVLAKLPNDQVRLSPNEVQPGENVVLLHDAEYNRNAGGFHGEPASPIGAVFKNKGDTQVDRDLPLTGPVLEWDGNEDE